MAAHKRIIVFGASGAIGSALLSHYSSIDCEVTAVARSWSGKTLLYPRVRWLEWDGTSHLNLLSELPFDVVIWAQGANCTDSIYDFDLDNHLNIYAANVLYILKSLNQLIQRGALEGKARLCVISSIWQSIARQNKMSYCVTKSALLGLVQSLSIDMGKNGILINAILPGALDTPMTRENLTESQVERLENMTPLGALATLDDVVNLVDFLCSDKNASITGQFIAADGGFSYAKII